VQRICVQFCLALYLSASLYGQESPSQQKPSVPDTPYSFMGLTPGESKTEADATLKVLPVQTDKPKNRYMKLFCLRSVPGPSSVGLEVCNSGGWDEHYIFDGGPTKLFTLLVVDGKVAVISYSFPQTDFAVMLSAMTDKYGPAASTKVKKLVNGFGAMFDSVETTWSNSLSEITLNELNPDNMKRSRVTVEDTALAAEYFKRVAAVTKPKI